MEDDKTLEQVQQYYKYLPGKRLSTLSLNDYVINKKDVITGQNFKRGRDIYSYNILISETERAFPEYDGRINKDVFGFLNKKIKSGIEEVWTVYGIIDRLSSDLAAMLYSLHVGSLKSRLVNDLTEADWDFWRTCSDVFLVGKVAEGELGRRLKHRITECLSNYGTHDILIRCPSNEQVKTLSLLGCAETAASYGKEIYVFDFGNTAIKCGRAVFDLGHYIVDECAVIIHQDYCSLENNMETAKQIHNEIVNAIMQTIEYYHEDRPTYCISMCMANNIINDKIMDRGTYRSLRLLSGSYPQYLRWHLEQVMHKDIKIHVMNDAQAVAMLFKKWSPHAAVITLGTYIGIAYP